MLKAVSDCFRYCYLIRLDKTRDGFLSIFIGKMQLNFCTAF